MPFILVAQSDTTTSSYDALGRMTHDGTQNLDITYNYLDMPEKVSRNDTLLVKYSYLADGMKTGARSSAGEGLEYRGTMTFRRSAQGALTFESVPFVAGRITGDGARHYSPSLSRWLVPDPMSEKYYDVSPYAYCANDPVNLVDPDGETIYIGPYRYNDGLLFDIDNAIMDLEELDDFTRSTYDALQVLSQSNTGQEIIKNLEVSDFNC